MALGPFPVNFKQIFKMKKLMIGGQALVKLGSSRQTKDTDYLVSIPGKPVFIFDKENNVDYINAAGNNKFFAQIWEMEDRNEGELASPLALLNLKAYSFVQHCLNGHFQKADDAEFDIKFLIRNFNLSIQDLELVRDYVSIGEFSEIEKVVKSVRK